MPNNSINSPSLGNIVSVNDAILITNGSGVGLLSTTLSGNYTFSGSNTFSGFNLFTLPNFFTDDVTFSSTESVYNTTTTITASDLSHKTIVSTPGAGGITLTLPTASSFNTELSSPPPNTAIEGISFTNKSATDSVTIAAGTSFSISGVPNPIILPLTTRFFKARKDSTTPSFILYG